MIQRLPPITRSAGRHVGRLLIRKLPADRIFHNLHHTIGVVQGVLEIGRAESLRPEELEIVLLAAWFHDTGHIKTYAGHEEESCAIAKKFLERKAYPNEKTEQVLGCIRATKMPQSPKNRLEEVVCDADMFHLSHPTYQQSQVLLREEWWLTLGHERTDKEWEQENDLFLLEHTYFTQYGKEVLQLRKDIYGLGVG